MLHPLQIQALQRCPVIGRNRLREARKLAGLTQIGLQNLTGLEQTFISKIEHGKYGDLTGETMRAIATVFGCAIEDVFPAPAVPVLRGARARVKVVA